MMLPLRKPSLPLTDFIELPSSKPVSDATLDPPVSLNLYVKSETWPFDSRGLLHNRSEAVSMREFKVRTFNESYTVSRQALQVSLQQRESSLRMSHPSRSSSESSEDLISIGPDRTGGLAVTRVCESYESNPDMWLNVTRRSSPLSVGSVLRFGSLRLVVADIAVTAEQLQGRGSTITRGEADGGEIFSDDSDIGSPFAAPRPPSPRSPSASPPRLAAVTPRSCRICLDGALPEDPLLRPCRCSGSVRYIHESCLLHWVGGRLRIKSMPNGGGSYWLKSVACEICKHPYRQSIYDSCVMSRPSGPHVILHEIEGVSNQPNPLVPAKLHVIAFGSARKIGVGRGKDVELLLTDISVSRKHGFFKLVDGGIVVEDAGSKFGTLVLAGKKFLLPAPGIPVSLQIGPSLITIKTGRVREWLEKWFLPKSFRPIVGDVREIAKTDPNPKALDKEKGRFARTRSDIAIEVVAEETPLQSIQISPSSTNLPSPSHRLSLDDYLAQFRHEGITVVIEEVGEPEHQRESLRDGQTS